ncbi:uncharacterized protein BJ171DRAFT_504216 [Polychytrium aggregatum]|uniref:uncharacterized protein n=1 Tax=Polychytrium aggregatum TaxID=110093 RepID=UPI0022FEB1E4|nr:uncharacterized protein BJ171DRAFT_504216 [Polychytrium aggregatum]KAI9204953.1 hypothetical protein BJ171DRAFT_504216 [Polychytrium aggregatum]
MNSYANVLEEAERLGLAADTLHPDGTAQGSASGWAETLTQLFELQHSIGEVRCCCRTPTRLVDEKSIASAALALMLHGSLCIYIFGRGVSQLNQSLAHVRRHEAIHDLAYSEDLESKLQYLHELKSNIDATLSHLQPILLNLKQPSPKSFLYVQREAQRPAVELLYSLLHLTETSKDRIGVAEWVGLMEMTEYAKMDPRIRESTREIMGHYSQLHQLMNNLAGLSDRVLMSRGHN